MRFVKGKTKMRHLTKTASTAFTIGDLVSISSGKITTATNKTTQHLGIIQESVKSTDADYASTTKKMVEVPIEPGAEIEADVTGSLATTNIGSAFDLSDASTVDAGSTSYKVMLCKGYINTAKGRFTLNSTEDYQDPNWE